jgi:hypothetical protein
MKGEITWTSQAGYTVTAQNQHFHVMCQGKGYRGALHWPPPRRLSTRLTFSAAASLTKSTPSRREVKGCLDRALSA